MFVRVNSKCAHQVRPPPGSGRRGSSLQGSRDYVPSLRVTLLAGPASSKRRARVFATRLRQSGSRRRYPECDYRDALETSAGHRARSAWWPWTAHAGGTSARRPRRPSRRRLGSLVKVAAGLLDLLQILRRPHPHATERATERQTKLGQLVLDPGVARPGRSSG